MAVISNASPAYCSFVVPHLDAAVAFFCDYFGFQVVQAPLQVPLQGDQLTRVHSMPPSATGRSALLQGAGLQMELAEWHSNGEALNPLRESSVPACHLAIRVPDLQAATTTLRDIHRMRIMEPEPGGAYVYCLTPYGIQLKLIQQNTFS